MGKYLFINQDVFANSNSKDKLFLVGCAALRACNIGETISYLGFTFNISNELQKRINKLTEAQAKKALEEIEKCL